MELHHLLTLDYIFLITLLPISAIIYAKAENVKFDGKKISCAFFIILLLAITPSMSFSPAYASNNEIKFVIKIRDTYPADSAFFDALIDPPLTNIAKAFAWVTFSHTGEQDHSDTFASWEIVDNSTLRIKGEDTATGNNAREFVATIIVYTDNSDINVQQELGTIPVSGTGTETFTIPTAINTTNTMMISAGHHHNATETTIGAEEIDRIRIVDSTTWEYNVVLPPNSGVQGEAVQIIDWNDPEILVQRGLFTLADGSTTGTVSPPTDIDRSRSILMFTYAGGTATSEEPNDFMVRGQLDATSPPDIAFERSASEDDMLISWEVIEFPADMVKVYHGDLAIGSGTLLATDIIPFVRDFDKTAVITASGTPFGFGTAEMSDPTTGAIDRGQFDLQLVNNTMIQATRGDSTGTADLFYQVIEFLEPNFPQNADANSSLRKVVQIKGEYTGATARQDYTISPPLDSLDKHMLFVTYRDDLDGSADTASRFWTWRVTDLSTFSILGSNDPSLTPNGMNFTATIIEFDSASSIFAQYDELQFADLDTNTDEKIMQMSPVNVSASFIIYDGWTSTGGETTVGQEEIPAIRIINGSQWGYDIELPSNEQESALNIQIVDLNTNRTTVQNGLASLTGTNLTVSPPIDVVRNQTLLLVSHSTTGSTFEVTPAEAGLLATLDDSSPPNMIFERIDGTAPSLDIRWTLIEMPSDLGFIQHGIHNQTAGIGNGTETITAINSTNAFAIGTVMTPNGHGNGKSTFATDDSWNEAYGQITLENSTTVRFERDATTSSWEVGFQTLEILTGAVIDLDIADTVTISPDNPDFIVNKTAIDIGTSIDLSTNKNITKLGADIVSSGDIISTGVIFVVNLDDTGTATDVLAINVTKLAQETVGTGDDPSFLITKLLEDTSSISDTVGVVVTFGVEILDTVTANDLVILNVTKTLSDVASTFDDLNLDTTKVFLDTTIVVDQTLSSTDTDVDETDIVNVPDDLIIDVSKLIQDVATLQDQVVLIRILDIALNDTVTVNEPSILFKITGTVSGTGGGGAGIPTPSFQRLIGLLITSEVINVEPSSVVPSDFVIEVFGQQFDDTFITGLQTTPQFATWFAFSGIPDELEFDVVIDNEKLIGDPRRVSNIALDDFVITTPNILCSDLDPFETQLPCIDPILYEVPVEFQFTKGGIAFNEKHTVIIDARVPIEQCILIGLLFPLEVCTVLQFVVDNWYFWVAIFVISYIFILIGRRKSKTFRIVRRVNRSDLLSMSDRKVKTKFKRGKRR